MFRLQLPRTVARKVTATTAALLLCLPTAVAPPALAQDEQLWGSATNRVGEQGPLRLSITDFSPRVAALHSTLTIKVQVHNTSDADISNVSLRLQRADALASSADARTILAEPESVFDVAGDFSAPIKLKAGETREITLKVPISAPTPEGLDITEAGTFPLLINANGRPVDDIDRLLAETRVLLPVTDPQATDAEPEPPADDETDGDTEAGDGDGSSDGAQDSTDNSDGPTRRGPVPFSLIWPISQPVPLVGGETGDAPASPNLILTDNSLADSLERGGRLDGLLTSLEKGFAGPDGQRLRESTCIAIDPETLDAISRMTRDYWIGTSRPSPVKASPRLRDSWGSTDDTDLTHMPASDSAAAWLNRLHNLTQDTCTLSLPWGGTDTSAVARVGDRELSMEALAAGQQTIGKHLNVQALPGVYLPAEGFVTSESTPLYSAATALNGTSPERAFEDRVDTGETTPPPPTPPEAAHGTTVLVADNTAITADGQTLQPGHSGVLVDGSRAFALPGTLAASLAATGRSPQTVAYSNLLGRYDFRIDSEAARMQTAIGTLFQSLTDSSDPRAAVVAAPPAGWDPRAGDAEDFMAAIRDAVDANLAEPTPLTDSITAAARDLDAGPVTPTDEIADPAPVSETLVEKAQMASREITDLTTIMSNDSNVALTRYEFTRPLRHDLLRSFTTLGRRNQLQSTDVQRHSEELSDQTLIMTRRLRNSVTLVAPGGVYTRATQLSPIAVLARNGLPLPVPAFVRVGVGDSVMEEKYEAAIPAKGAVTIQFTPKSGDDAESTPATNAPEGDRPRDSGENSHNLLLWLESPYGTPISQSVSISVQSGASVGVLAIVILVIVTVGGFFAAKRSQYFRK